MTVCTGNICRSPMSEVVLRDRFSAAGLGEFVVVDSTGISGEERGNPMDRRAVSVLMDHGYDDPALRSHRARQVRSADLVAHELVLAMTSAHAGALRRLAGVDGSLAGRVRLYREFDPAAPVLRPGDPEHPLDIDDPWYGDRSAFVACLAQVEAAADAVVAHVVAQLNTR
ncbi:MAG TPA: low molecular weight protein-tyrosine-phosphatase [Cellulomonadaceae bacterium]|nr:low molecular weight protein-tyrosine-phosphatase [Cellulomonadaceae bacterium]